MAELNKPTEVSKSRTDRSTGSNEHLLEAWMKGHKFSDNQAEAVLAMVDTLASIAGRIPNHLREQFADSIPASMPIRETFLIAMGKDSAVHMA